MERPGNARSANEKKMVEAVQKEIQARQEMERMLETAVSGKRGKMEDD